MDQPMDEYDIVNLLAKYGLNTALIMRDSNILFNVHVKKPIVFI